MSTIAVIGAGGLVFPLRLIADILSHAELQGSTLRLMDIDEARLRLTTDAVLDLSAHHRLPARIEATTDRRRALDGATHVFLTFQVGGLEAYRCDVEIPRRYGVDQTVGDTLGPGGVFRFLRTVPVLRQLAADIAELCPGALVLNYVNPMAMNCWFLDRMGVRTVGLCHSVQGTSRMLARQLDVPYEELRFQVAGINHQAWFLELKRQGEDLYPHLRDTMRRRHLHGSTGMARNAPEEAEAGNPTESVESVYEGRQEQVRAEIMAAFGYFQTESSHHASEYLPYFRTSAERVGTVLPERWDYYDICSAQDAAQATAHLLDRLKATLEPSHEYGAPIVHGMVTGRPLVVYGNVPNHGLIPNLPEGCSVEVPCHVDSKGVQPMTVGRLPPQCAALNRTNINVQELAVEAAVREDIDHIYHAVMLDPLTAALLPLGRIRELVDELRAAEAAWLPEFARPDVG